MKLIPLTQGKFAIVDDRDYGRLIQFNWVFVSAIRNQNQCGYASSRINGKNIPMHRLILNTPDGMVVDHVNQNGLDNRRNNIRNCTQSQNMQNSGKKKTNPWGFKGVSFHKPTKSWMARIRFSNGFRKNLGYFRTPKDAGEAYAIAAKIHHGEFARL